MGTAQHTQRAYNLEVTSDCEVYSMSLRRRVPAGLCVLTRMELHRAMQQRSLKKFEFIQSLDSLFFKYSPVIF